MNVANIMPGDEIKVELKYTELLVPTEGVYEFVYPTVVGPRYSNRRPPTALPPSTGCRTPICTRAKPRPYTFDIPVDIGRGIPLQELACPRTR